MAPRLPPVRVRAETLPDHLAAVESLLAEWAKGAATFGPMAEAVASLSSASVALRAALRAGALEHDPDAATLAALPLPDEAAAERGPSALVALSRPSRAIETVLQVQGFSVVRCEPSQLVSRAREMLPALIVLDPFSEPGAWAAFYEWRREARLAHTEALLVRTFAGRADAPLGDAAFLARPLGRGDLSTRVRAVLAGRETVARAIVASPDDSCLRLETLLGAGGTQVLRATDAAQLSTQLAEGADLVFVPLVFDGLGADRIVEQVQPRGEGPRLVFLIGPSDAEQTLVSGLGERFARDAARPLAQALDAVITRATRAEEAHGPGALRGVLSMRVFLSVFERVLDYTTRHGRKLLVLRVGFAEGPAGSSVPNEIWQDLGAELAARFRLHDPVARSRTAGVLVMLADAAPDQGARIQAAVFESVHRLLADRHGRPLPPFVFTAISCPDEARDVPSLLARLA